MRVTTIILAIALLSLLTSLGSASRRRTSNGLQVTINLPTSISDLIIDKHPVSSVKGGMSLIDPHTGAPPGAGKFTLSAQTHQESNRIVLEGVVTAAGDQETVCQLQARIPIGDEGWLFWDDMTRSRVIKRGGGYVQSVYPVCCVTDSTRQLGLAVGLDPDPLQPATLSYDPGSKAIIVNWFFGFTPLARPEYRMRAPFKIDIYRVLPKWAFRSALDGYYHSHPKKFDWRAKYEGLWLFASASDSLPNPQHYTYNEGGPPPSNDLPRGLHTFPYCCTGDLIVSLPPEWGVPKTYDEMLDRLRRWEKQPRLTGWEQLSDYEIDATVAHTGERSLKLSASKTGQDKEVRQILDLNQKRVDPITVSVWTKAQDATGTKDPNYGVWLDMEMTDGEHQYFKVASGEVGSHDWQELKLIVGKDKPIAQIRLYLLFRRTHTGVAWFDDVSVTASSNPKNNFVHNADFEDTSPPPQMVLLRDNVMYDQQDHMIYFADTWGGADVPPESPINWLRYTVLVNPDQKNPGNRPTASSIDLEKYDKIYEQWPQCAGAYMDGTSACCTTTFEYRRDHFYCFNDPFQYNGTNYRPCASGKASVVRWVEAFKERYRKGQKLAFGNIWASNSMFPVCMALDVCGYESSKWYDLEYADYYRAAAYHKPGLYLNYFRLGQQLDTREGGEKFFRYATAYGLFPSIGRFTDEAYEKFGDLQHLYVPIVKHLFRAGWEPVTYAEENDPVVRVQRFGMNPDFHKNVEIGTKLPMYFTVLNPSPVPREVELAIDAQTLGLTKSAITVVEMATSASLPLRKDGSSLVTHVTLGPEDAAVIALLPANGVGAWYRERAAESLQGAAFVYAQTPPTVEAATLAKRVREIISTNPAQVAKTINAIKVDIERLQADGAKLPEDLKRRSYLRELSEAERLLNESLLADVGGQVGWHEGLIAPVDKTITISPLIPREGGKPVVIDTRTCPGRLIELPPGAMTGAPDRHANVASTVTCPPERAVTASAEVEFKDAAGSVAHVTRRGYAFFGPICELRAQAEADASRLSAHLKNSDTSEREFRLEVSSPQGITLTPATMSLRLNAGESKDLVFQIMRSPEVKSGTYPVKVIARTQNDAIAEQTEVPVVYILPLERGDLALASAGAHVAVDSSFYAYNEKPINDGIVNPVGVAFNEGAWASGESVEEHWVEIQWPQPQTVGRTVIYWNAENNVVWTSRHIKVQVKDTGAWKTVSEVSNNEPQPVTECEFAPVKTQALRILQPKGDGPATRPNLMWLREVAVYAK